MSKTINEKKKVFLCYAREDPDPLDHFVDLFRDYNPEFDIQFDQTPHSGNMHARFKNFARTCDVALILVNARLLSEESYANLHEIPILKRRLEKKHVVVLGILIQDVRPDTWNKNGYLYFFNLTNNQIPSVRRIDAYRQKHNRQFAVYKALDENGKDTFHKELREWILDLILEHQEITYEQKEPETDSLLQNGLLLRPRIETDKILEKMTTDKLLWKIEDKLSRTDTFWINASIQLPSDKDSYAWWFFHILNKRYREVGASVAKMSPLEFDKGRSEIELQITKKNELLLSLFKGSSCTECMTEITDFQSKIDDFLSIMMKSDNPDFNLNRFQKQIIKYCNSISICLQLLSERAYKVSKPN